MDEISPVFDSLKNIYRTYDINSMIDYVRKAKKGDERARTIVLGLNIVYVYKIAKRYNQKYNNVFIIEELMSPGLVGLNNAIDKFLISSKNKFQTFAYWSIRAKISRYAEYNFSLIKIPPNEVKRRRDICKKNKKVKDEWKSIHSLNYLCGEENNIEVQDLFYDSRSCYIKHHYKDVFKSIMEMEEFKKRDKNILLMYLQNYTKRDISAHHKLSDTRVGQIIKDMVTKIRNKYNKSDVIL